MKGRALCGWMVGFGIAGVAACVAPAVQPPPVAARAPAVVAPPLPADDDWRSLLPVPLGSTVRQIPFAMKEVLLFQGEARNSGEPDEQECYSKSGVPFKFRGYEAEDYVLCFFRDRLFRAEVVLRLPKDIPTATFAHWCDEWLTGVEVTNLIADRCEGRENDIGFTAGMTYDTEIAGPLVTLVVYDLPTRELYERRAKTPLP